jgi:hypothetical protein
VYNVQAMDADLHAFLTLILVLGESNKTQAMNVFYDIFYAIYNLLLDW